MSPKEIPKLLDRLDGPERRSRVTPSRRPRRSMSHGRGSNIAAKSAVTHARSSTIKRLSPVFCVVARVVACTQFASARIATIAISTRG
jgi:hypothetical protein